MVDTSTQTFLEDLEHKLTNITQELGEPGDLDIWIDYERGEFSETYQYENLHINWRFLEHTFEELPERPNALCVTYQGKTVFLKPEGMLPIVYESGVWEQKVEKLYQYVVSRRTPDDPNIPF